MLLFGKCNIPFIYDKPQCDVKNFDIRNYKSEKIELLLNSRRYSILVKCIILSSERPLLWNQLLKVVLYVFQINNIHLSPKDFNPSRPGHFWKLYWNKKLSLIFIFTLLCGASEGFEVPLRCAFEVPWNAFPLWCLRSTFEVPQRTENKNLTYFFCLRPGLGREGLTMTNK